MLKGCPVRVTAVRQEKWKAIMGEQKDLKRICFYFSTKIVFMAIK